VCWSSGAIIGVTENKKSPIWAVFEALQIYRLDQLKARRIRTPRGQPDTTDGQAQLNPDFLAAYLLLISAYF
jgi:hypothetical protein